MKGFILVTLALAATVFVAILAAMVVLIDLLAKLLPLLVVLAIGVVSFKIALKLMKGSRPRVNVDSDPLVKFWCQSHKEPVAELIKPVPTRPHLRLIHGEEHLASHR